MKKLGIVAFLAIGLGGLGIAIGPRSLAADDDASFQGQKKLEQQRQDLQRDLQRKDLQRNSADRKGGGGGEKGDKVDSIRKDVREAIKEVEDVQSK